MRDKKPEIADAERWLDPDTFVFEGNTYIVTPDIKVIRAKIKPKNVINKY